MRKTTSKTESERDKGSASDPYGRNFIPKEPSKPKHFSPLRPLKYLIWGWFWFTSGLIKWGWHTAEKTDGAVILPMVMLIFFYGGVLPAVVAVEIGLTGVWIIVAILCWILFHFALHFMFHLNEKEGRNYWKNKLIG